MRQFVCCVLNMTSEYCYRNDVPTTVSRHSLLQMGSLIKKLSSNLESWQKTWMSWISWTNGSEKKRGWMMVDPNDLGKLSTEIAQLSKSLPKLVNNRRVAASNVINELSKGSCSENHIFYIASFEVRQKGYAYDTLFPGPPKLVWGVLSEYLRSFLNDGPMPVPFKRG
eukprot:XP_014779888.1 PREDICTED: uncharacterized protein LOC106876028 [Octopus bimaculoides]